LVAHSSFAFTFISPCSRHVPVQASSSGQLSSAKFPWLRDTANFNWPMLAQLGVALASHFGLFGLELVVNARFRRKITVSTPAFSLAGWGCKEISSHWPNGLAVERVSMHPSR
jgi:hypothetical protein